MNCANYNERVFAGAGARDLEVLSMKLSFSSSFSSRVAVATFLWIGLSLVVSRPVSARSPIDEVQRGYELIDDYVVVKDGNEIRARVYSSSESRAILIVPEDIATPSVILWPRTREVESLKSMKVQTLPGGFVEVKKQAVAASHPPFEVVGTDVLFDVGGTEMRLRPKPHLLGLFDARHMLEESLVYARRADDYTPTPELLEKLGRLSGRVRVRVFFGSWCSACGQMVPRILSVAERLGESNLDFEFYGLPKVGFSDDAQAKAYNIKSVPTGVVFVDDLEVGRIQGNDWRSPESALWDLLDS